MAPERGGERGGVGYQKRDGVPDALAVHMHEASDAVVAWLETDGAHSFPLSLSLPHSRQ